MIACTPWLSRCPLLSPNPPAARDPQTGAKSLLYQSAPFLPDLSDETAEIVHQFLLKGQGICNIICMIVLLYGWGWSPAPAASQGKTRKD